MKKLIALLLVVGVVFVSISGCGGSGTTNATKTSGPGGGSGTTHASSKS